MEFKNQTGEDKVVTLSQPGLPANHIGVKAGDSIDLPEHVGNAYGFTSSEAVLAFNDPVAIETVTETVTETPEAEEGSIHQTPVETKQKRKR